MKAPQKINTQEELDILLKENSPLECFILLGGCLRSSKDIYLNGDNDYSVFNEIDDTEEFISHDKFKESFLGEAMSKGALYMY